MEVHSSDVVQMSKEGEEAPAKLVVPHFYLVVVASGAQERFHGVEVDAANCAAKTKSKAGCLVNDSLLGLGFASWGKARAAKACGKANEAKQVHQRVVALFSPGPSCSLKVSMIVPTL